eukprot:COSAG05_NODE_2239_length_3353_cov_423.015980_5_plen_134_part_00
MPVAYFIRPTTTLGSDLPLSRLTPAVENVFSVHPLGRFNLSRLAAWLANVSATDSGMGGGGATREGPLQLWVAASPRRHYTQVAASPRKNYSPSNLPIRIYRGLVRGQRLSPTGSAGCAGVSASVGSAGFLYM